MLWFLEGEESGIKDARGAEAVVYEQYADLFGPQPYNFRTQRQGDTWVVRFDILSDTEVEEHEWHIDAGTGEVLRK